VCPFEGVFQNSSTKIDKSLPTLKQQIVLNVKKGLKQGHINIKSKNRKMKAERERKETWVASQEAP